MIRITKSKSVASNAHVDVQKQDFSWVEMQNGTTILVDSLAVFYKLNILPYTQ